MIYVSGFKAASKLPEYLNRVKEEMLRTANKIFHSTESFDVWLHRLSGILLEDRPMKSSAYVLWTGTLAKSGSVRVYKSLRKGEASVITLYFKQVNNMEVRTIKKGGKQ